MDTIRTLRDYPSQILKPYEEDRDYAHIADWLRLYLLYHKGGVWMDISSVVLYRIDNVYDLNNNTMQMYTAAWAHDIPESWFIVSPPRLLLTKTWLQEFTLALKQSLSVYTTSNEPYILEDLRERLPYLTLNLCFCKARQIVANSQLQYTPLASADAPGSPLHIAYAYYYNIEPGKALPVDIYPRFWKGFTKGNVRHKQDTFRQFSNTIHYLCTTRHIPTSITTSFIKLTGGFRRAILYGPQNFTTYINHAHAHIFTALKFNKKRCLQFKRTGSARTTSRKRRQATHLPHRQNVRTIRTIRTKRRPSRRQL